MKLVKYIIIIVFLVLSILIMESGHYLKNIGKGDNIPELLIEIENDVDDEKWTDAKNKVSEIKIIYNKITKLIQFSVERNDIIEFTYHLSLLDGFIKAEDPSSSTGEIYILRAYWEELGK